MLRNEKVWTWADIPALLIFFGMLYFDAVSFEWQKNVLSVLKLGTAGWTGPAECLLVDVFKEVVKEEDCTRRCKM